MIIMGGHVLAGSLEPDLNQRPKDHRLECAIVLWLLNSIPSCTFRRMQPWLCVGRDRCPSCQQALPRGTKEKFVKPPPPPYT
ncbi:hypothetical protein LAZ67_2003977 [Cordylochernes scorpioides]|uniref:Uncharacterized protein n=1 Tax=Cordylochernes scorpioides TaxID=51811 RepID=A0ABY6K3F2_9ARAC|nr:hypothetical protein LAZ67_2003977 [Cordylochernes scorpioides]